MGRRSINTTKSGKYMNPTDQARKEARKLELKKNKKQRQMVRAAVLKGKDPIQILDEMEKIDQMEFNVNQPSPLNEKVLRDKRKKLRDTLDRVLNMYHRDDPEKWNDLKRKQTDYEHKRNQLVSFYESVKSAQQVSVDEIPLPQISEQPPAASQIPLPAEVQKPQHTIYSIATALKLQALGQPVREPPGCPPGIAPEINSDGEEADFARDILQSRSRDEEKKSDDLDDGPMSKPSFVQQKMLALSGQNIDEFMKEIESSHKPKGGVEEEGVKSKVPEVVPPGTDNIQPLQPPIQKNPPPPLNPILFPGHLRLPPGPPPGRPIIPPGPPPGLPQPRMPPMRMAPPRMMHFPNPVTSLPAPTLGLRNPNVLSAAPQLIGAEGSKQQGATITAKPQIRNLSADVTRFVPSTLRIKREDKKFKTANHLALVNELKQKEMMASISAIKPQTKDDAYMQFMKEMQGLL